MKVSINWAQSVSNIDISSLSKDELIKKVGLQLGAIEEVIDYGARFEDIVVAKVISCENHPSADRLHVCRVDDGGVTKDVVRDDEGYVQVVCGAPNVQEGMLVAWLPPGSTVPVSFDEKVPFVLGARELRGVMSYGMLASGKELGLNDDHDGILEITEDVSVGAPFNSLYDLDDLVLDLENKMFTHRPDCFGILGVSRELAGITNQQFNSPDWYQTEPYFEHKDTLPFEAVVESELVPRFVAVAMDSVQVNKSPVWLQSALARIGVKSINNVVDITNYVMHLTGQPLHAYDYDKIAARSEAVPSLIARSGVSGEKLILLNGKIIELDGDSLVIATQNSVVGLAGVMGGNETEVDDNTNRIIIEIATFDMYNIRRSSMKYGLFTDAVTRFNKGQSPHQNTRVLSYAMRLLHEMAGAEQASDVKDLSQVSTDAKVLQITPSFINDRLGSELSAEDMLDLLKNVEFQVEINDNKLIITVPFWRQDIEFAEDIVEEVGRLYGFERLPVILPRRSVEPVSLDPLYVLKKKVRTIMASAGANEVLTYNFVHGRLLENVGQSIDDAFRLRNALSPELQYYRLSLIPSLLNIVYPNLKAGHEEFVVYELGKCHNKHHIDDEQLPVEFPVFAGLYATKKSSKPAFYQAKKYLDFVASQFGIAFNYSPIETEALFPVTKPFDLSRSALVSVKGTEIYLGIVGEFNEGVSKSMKIPQATAGFEIGLEELLSVVGSHNKYEPLSRFPGTSMDVCFRVDQNVPFAHLEASIENVLASVTEDTNIELIDIYQGDDIEYKQVTIRISMVDHVKTMTSEDAHRIIKKVTDTVTNEIGATVV